MSMTQKDYILHRLSNSPVALACHEFNIVGVSENSIATRLSELAREGRVLGDRRPGKPYKEWRLTKTPTLPGF
jgi:DNA-binding HxlR family transcriptional regulator